MNNFRTTKLEVDIDQIQPNPWNPNQMDSKTFEKEKKSITELGFLGSVLVREHNVKGYYQILDGEHRWKALKELGYTKVTIENIGEISDEEAKLLTVLINNLRGKDDVFKRAKILEALQEGQLSLLPMTAEEIEHEKRFVEFDFSKFEKEAEEKETSKFPTKVVSLLFTDETEEAVWNKAKEEMMKRDMIKSKNKKKQDVEMVMILIKSFLKLAIGIESFEGDKVSFESDS